MNDERLLQEFVRGDMGAFNQIVKNWERSLYHFIYRYVGTAEDARDITQETFLQVYRNAHRFKQEAKFSTWLYQIAINLCRSLYRKKKGKTFISLDQDQDAPDRRPNRIKESLTAKGSLPDEALNQSELTDVLRKTLMTLPEDQRVVIILKEYNGMSFQEISELLGRPLSTVKSRMYAGLKMLSDKFAALNIRA